MFEKSFRVSLIYTDTVLVEATTKDEADKVFDEYFNGNSIDTEQVPCSAIFIEPLATTAFKKELINNIDDCEILKRD